MVWVSSQKNPDERSCFINYAPMGAREIQFYSACNMPLPWFNWFWFTRVRDIRVSTQPYVVNHDYDVIVTPYRIRVLSTQENRTDPSISEWVYFEMNSLTRIESFSRSVLLILQCFKNSSKKRICSKTLTQLLILALSMYAHWFKMSLAFFVSNVKIRQTMTAK